MVSRRPRQAPEGRCGVKQEWIVITPAQLKLGIVRDGQRQDYDVITRLESGDYIVVAPR